MQGHVRQVTDVDGDAIAEYQYDAWGLIQLTAASAMAFGDWGYTWDGKPGRYYVQQRHLRADLGRWTSRDPVETEPPYAYVGDRPTWAVDPSGLDRMRPALPAAPSSGGAVAMDDLLAVLSDPRQRRQEDLRIQQMLAISEATAGTDQWSMWKWIYTGDPRAPESTYRAALEQGATEMNAQLDRWHPNDRAFAWFRAKVDDWMGAAKRLKASPLARALWQTLPPIAQKGLDAAGAANAAAQREYEGWRAKLPFPERLFTCPYPLSEQGVKYTAGYVFGVTETVIDALPVWLGRDFLDFLRMCSSDDTPAALAKGIGVLAGGLGAELEGAEEIDPCEAGRFAGRLLVNLVLLGIAALGAARALRTLTRRGGLGEMLGEVAHGPRPKTAHPGTGTPRKGIPARPAASETRSASARARTVSKVEAELRKQPDAQQTIRSRVQYDRKALTDKIRARKAARLSGIRAREAKLQSELEAWVAQNRDRIVAKGTGPRGRGGGDRTREMHRVVAEYMRRKDYKITGGKPYRKEERLDLDLGNRSPKGSRYVDLSFEHKVTGEVVRVHTVTPGDASELAKELAIRRRRPEDILIVLPKL